MAGRDGDPNVLVSAASRKDCVDALRRAMGNADGEALVVEVVPLLAGVAEASQVMNWDKRRVITYLDRGRFPAPLQALASGRVWIRDEVQRFADEWRARQSRRPLKP